MKTHPPLLVHSAPVQIDTVETRLARALLLAKFSEGGAPDQVMIHISQQALAEKVGSSRAPVSAHLRGFRKLDYINDVGGGIEVRESLLAAVGSWKTRC